jgi:membrane protein required for colicin V production
MVIDIVFLLLALLAVYKGWTKGFIMAIFVFISYFVALGLALYFSGYVEGYIRSKSSTDSPWYSFLSFVLVLIGGIVAVRILGKIMERSAQVMMLGLFNRVMGMVLFGLIYFGFLAVILVYLDRFGLVGDASAKESRTHSFLMASGRWLVDQFADWMPVIKNLFNDAKEIIKQDA